MFVTYFQYLPYVQGDEYYNLSELTTVELEELINNDISSIQAYPNPFFKEGVSLLFEDVKLQNAKVIIYNSRGEKVKVFGAVDSNKIFWNGMSNNRPAPGGIYYVSANINGNFFNKRLIKVE